MTVIHYLNRVIKYFPKEVKLMTVIPAMSHFFEMRQDFPKLIKNGGIIFHNCVAKLMFFSKFTRGYTLKAVTLLPMRLK